ncbi:hypothetical protein KA531_01460 [Candidatus Saccharibacteria bacterium]|nr:hypothetical protein [Candidatus Saccharibacteria bacterium]
MSKFELKTGEDSEKEDAIEESIGGLFAREEIAEEFVIHPRIVVLEKKRVESGMVYFVQRRIF